MIMIMILHTSRHPLATGFLATEHGFQRVVGVYVTSVDTCRNFDEQTCLDIG